MLAQTKRWKQLYKGVAHQPIKMSLDKQPCLCQQHCNLYALFKPCNPCMAAKAMFYVAQVCYVSVPFWHGLEADVEHWAARLKGEKERAGLEDGT
jgi:hypothetical protein